MIRASDRSRLDTEVSVLPSSMCFKFSHCIIWWTTWSFLQHFEDFVAGHFRKRGQAILVACRAYLDGAQVGCLVGGGVQDVDEGDKSCTAQFKSSLKSVFHDLLMELTVKGADCDSFLVGKVKDGASGAADTTLKL